jgi:hypothetical protein
MSEQQFGAARPRIFRWLAAATALLLGAAGLSLTATAALADPSNYNASLSVAADNYSPGPFDNVVFTATLTPLNGADCAGNQPTLSWTDSNGAGGSFQSQSTDGGVITAIYNRAPLGNGQALTFTAHATDGCVVPDSETSPIEASTGVTSHYYQNYVYGYVIQGSPGATQWSDPTTRIGGVTVDLIDVNDQFGAVVYTTVSDAETGGYVLYAPFNSASDIDLTYKIRFTFPDETVLWFNDAANPWTTSTTSWEVAASGGIFSWVNQAYSAYVAADSGESDPPPDTTPSQTNVEKMCFRYGSGISNFLSFETDAANWGYLCLTDPGVEEVTTLPNDHGDGLDGFGFVYFDQYYQRYYVSADEETHSSSEGTFTSVITDNDIYLVESASRVDVTITRTIQGSFMKWQVEVRDSTTHEIVDVPFHFGGDLGSDNGTEWTRDGNWLVSEDNYAGRQDGDPILVHNIDASSYDLNSVDGNDDLDLNVDGGELTYILGALDYTGCIDPALIASASVIAQDAVARFGDSVDTLTGGECEGDEFVFELPIGELQVGVPVDLSIQLPEGDLWDWTYGGALSLLASLPDGLYYTSLGNWNEDGVPPYLHLFGTPTTVGSIDVPVQAWDDFDNVAVGHLTGSIVDTAVAADWPVPTVNPMQVDASFDQTFTPPLVGHNWNWSAGGVGGASNLPDGLSVEVLDPWSDEMVPSIHLTGTPTVAGPYDITLWADDDYGNEVVIHVTGTVLGPIESADLTLGAQIGDVVAGAEVDFSAQGVKEGAEYTLYLHSSPVLLSFGTVAASHTILGTALIPSDLEPGWHSLTLTSRWFSQTDFQSFDTVLWFLIGADGTLLARNLTGPTALAVTGTSDPAGGFLLAGGAFLFGLLLVLGRKQRRLGR